LINKMTQQQQKKQEKAKQDNVQLFSVTLCN